ncbi:SAM-dependent methyltransferase [[Kitasatospora] papulosa]|uniref:SAM-dependent methyltransferase n=1 Tax=[Kitasatospora] papulosa TaxID=1464011 RepID=UPI0036C9EA9B
MTRSVPPLSPARVHAELLGGDSASPLDSAVVRRVTKAAPWWRAAAWELHRDGLRLVTHLAAQGLDQFLDLGSGLPSPGRRQVHSLATAFNRSRHAARTVYVDCDSHAHDYRCMSLVDRTDAVSVRADITDTEALFEHPAVQQLDPQRPFVVLLHDVLHWMPEETAARLIADLRHRLPRGSFISFTHLLPAPPPYATTPLVGAYREAGIGLWPRDLSVITAWSGTWPAYTNGPHTGAGLQPVCASLLRTPRPGPFSRPIFWSSSRGHAPHSTPPTR